MPWVSSDIKKTLQAFLTTTGDAMCRLAMPKANNKK